MTSPQKGCSAGRLATRVSSRRDKAASWGKVQYLADSQLSPPAEGVGTSDLSPNLAHDPWAEAFVLGPEGDTELSPEGFNPGRSF